MPKKTKKQKIISDYRKKIRAISSSVQPVSNEMLQTSSPVTSAPTISLSHIEPRLSTQTAVTHDILPAHEFLAIKKDLITTLIITIGILVGEFAIAWFVRF